MIKENNLVYEHGEDPTLHGRRKFVQILIESLLLLP